MGNDRGIDDGIVGGNEHGPSGRNDGGANGWSSAGGGKRVRRIAFAFASPMQCSQLGLALRSGEKNMHIARILDSSLFDFAACCVQAIRCDEGMLVAAVVFLDFSFSLVPCIIGLAQRAKIYEWRKYCSCFYSYFYNWVR